MGYALVREHRGNGFMPEALRAVIRYEFAVLATPQLSATCDVANHPSLHVLEKIGMRRESEAFEADAAGRWARRYRYVLPRGACAPTTEKPLQGNGAAS